MGHDLRQLIREHRKNRTAIPAFNYSDVWDLKAIVESGAETTVPIIVASDPSVVAVFGVKVCAAMVRGLAEQHRTPLFHHLDHSKTVELCIAAVDSGYESVMIDGSDKDLDTNIAMVKEVVHYAHKKDVMVEAEIGRIDARGAELPEVELLADAAAALAERSGVDALAVGIGITHRRSEGTPEVDFEGLSEIAARVAIPLVLRDGGGIADEDIRRGIDLGISKVDVDAVIHVAYMRALMRELEAAGVNRSRLDVMEEVLLSVKALVLDRINTIARS